MRWCARSALRCAAYSTYQVSDAPVWGRPSRGPNIARFMLSSHDYRTDHCGPRTVSLRQPYSSPKQPFKGTEMKEDNPLGVAGGAGDVRAGPCGLGPRPRHHTIELRVGNTSSGGEVMNGTATDDANGGGRYG